MPKLNDSGFAHLVVLLVLVGGLVAGLILIKNPAIFKPKAANPLSAPIGIGYQKVFVTSTTYTGNLGGLSGADSKCQARATAANLSGVWKAWLSTGDLAASSRITHSANPYKLVDGKVVANDWNDLVDGTIQNPIIKDELGNVVTNGEVWTNTRSNGGPYYGLPIQTCNDWTLDSGGSNSSVFLSGNAFKTNAEWTNRVDVAWACSNQRRLYCFEQSTNIIVISPSPSLTPTPTTLSQAPDLVVNSIQALGRVKVRGKNSINVTIQNKGNVSMRSTGVVALKFTQPDSADLGSCSNRLNPVAAGKTTKVQVRNCPAFKVSGNHTITATVDSTDVVKESNENNNQFTTTVNVIK